MSTPARIVLASGSRYRAELLRRIVPDFDALAPEIAEDPLPGETPGQTASRLAEQKARAIAARDAHDLVIGSDQVAELEGDLLGKPGNFEEAHRQLSLCSGKTARFHTAVCVLSRHGREFRAHEAADLTRVHFRKLGDAEILRYLHADNPLDCAGSFRVEALGVSLFEQVETQDPTALIGLPLIRLCHLLRQAGMLLP